METERNDLISEDLARIMNNVSQFSTHPKISEACYQLLVAANELLCLRYEKELHKEDMRYINSSLEWGEKARAILSDIAVELHER